MIVDFNKSHLPTFSPDTQDPIEDLKKWMVNEAELIKLHLLQPNCAARLVMPTSLKVKTIILLFHGFGSGTWVFEEWIKSYSSPDTLIIAPRLPGSGFMRDGIGHGKYLPTSAQSHDYEEMVTHWIDICTLIGADIIVAGHSAGGTLAYRFAQRCTVQRLFLIAPFFDTEDLVGKCLFSTMKWIKTYLKLPLHIVLDSINWRLKDSFNTGISHLPGHSTMTLGQLYSIYAYATTIFKSKERLKTTIVWITASQYDTRSSMFKIKSLMKRLKFISPPIECNFTIFSPDQEVPHAMIHPMQNKFDDVTNFLKGQFLQWLHYR
jgi:pimeloyl-ACP methyl ester carboxylesterase